MRTYAAAFFCIQCSKHGFDMRNPNREVCSDCELKNHNTKRMKQTTTLPRTACEDLVKQLKENKFFMSKEYWEAVKKQIKEDKKTTFNTNNCSLMYLNRQRVELSMLGILQLS